METDKSMEELKTLEENTTKLEAVASLQPNRLVIKCNQVPTREHDNSAYFNICSAQNIVLEPKMTTVVQTGL